MSVPPSPAIPGWGILGKCGAGSLNRGETRGPTRTLGLGAADGVTAPATTPLDGRLRWCWLPRLRGSLNVGLHDVSLMSELTGPFDSLTPVSLPYPLLWLPDSA